MMGNVIDILEGEVIKKHNLKMISGHRDCNYCHLYFDCAFYERETGDTLCEFTYNFNKKER